MAFLEFWKNAETKDKIPLISAILAASIVAIGWFINGYLNRRNDVAKRRLDHRLEALKSVLLVWFVIEKNSAPFRQPDFLQKLETARVNFQLYGKEDEIELLEGFIHACEKSNLDDANTKLKMLVPFVRNRIRDELEIDD